MVLIALAVAAVCLLPGPDLAAARVSGVAADTGAFGVSAAKKRCQRVRVKLRRGGKVVKRNGKPVYRTVRRCKPAKKKRCRVVRLKKRTKSGKVVRRHGKPVYVRRRRCKPKPTPPPAAQPSPTPGPAPGSPHAPPPAGRDPNALANQVLALASHAPADINLFSSTFTNGAQGIFPSGSAMSLSDQPVPTEAQVRSKLTAYLNERLGGTSAQVGEALALFDNDDVIAQVPNPTLRAALVGLKGSFAEAAIDNVLGGDRTFEIFFGALPNAATVANTSRGSDHFIIIFNEDYVNEDFRNLMGVMTHELGVHATDGSDSTAEEIVAYALTGMVQLQVLAVDPELAYRRTQLARIDNTYVMNFVNSREAGFPNSEIYAPTGTGVAPGSPFDSPDLWTLYGGGDGSTSPGSDVIDQILRDLGLPTGGGFDQPMAESFEGLNDTWASDVQRAQISFLLRLVSVGDVAQVTGLSPQQIIDTLRLQPYLDVIN